MYKVCAMTLEVNKLYFVPVYSFWLLQLNKQLTWCILCLCIMSWPLLAVLRGKLIYPDSLGSFSGELCTPSDVLCKVDWQHACEFLSVVVRKEL